MCLLKDLSENLRFLLFLFVYILSLSITFFFITQPYPLFLKSKRKIPNPFFDCKQPSQGCPTSHGHFMHFEILMREIQEIENPKHQLLISNYSPFFNAIPVLFETEEFHTHLIYFLFSLVEQSQLLYIYIYIFFVVLANMGSLFTR